MSLNELPKRTAGSTIAVGEVRRPSSPTTEVVVEVQGPRPFEGADPWRTRAINRRGIVMRVVGGSLPNWVEPIHESAPECIFDIVVVPDATQFAANENYEVRAIICMYRVVIIGGQEGMMSDALWSRLPRADIAVSASTIDLEAVAQCFVNVATGGGIIGVDWADVLEVVGRRGSQAVRGRAIVVLGQGSVAGRAARDALAKLEEEGNVAGIVLFQSVSVADTPPYDLWDMDVLATTAMVDRDEGKLVLTGACDRQRTEVVVIRVRWARLRLGRHNMSVAELLIAYLNVRPARPRQTLIEIAGYADKELVWSRLLAHFLDHRRGHGMSRLFLHALTHEAKCLDENEFVEDVDLEVKTERGKSIDIMVTTNKRIITIENKVYATANNDFGEYQRDTRKRAEKVGRKELLILLSLYPLDQSRNGFITVTWRREVAWQIRTLG